MPRRSRLSGVKGVTTGNSSGQTCAMKTQKTRGVKPTSLPGQRKSCFTLRGRKKKDVVIRGKLRIHSMPGAFLVLGVIVVVVGTALAVVGYWPYRISRPPLLGAADGERISELPTANWSGEENGLLSKDGPIHKERMKLLGPVIMGVGLFILICANTVLYENRDRETQILMAQMRSVICSVSAAVPSADLKEMAAANSMAKHYQWVSSLPAAHLNILCLQQMASSEPLLQTRQPIEHRHSMQSIYQRAVLQTEALHHHESELPPPTQSCHFKPWNSCQTDLKTQQSGATFSLRAGPLGKLNSCLVSASSMSTLNEVDIPAVQQRRCHSMSYRTNPHVAHTGVHLEEQVKTPKAYSCINEPVATRREAGSQVCVNILGLAEDAVEEQTHHSWPHLYRSSGRRYLKLENKEDSVDKLLEQQSSRWDISFGSGPFQ